jgi:steroid 5-alpha reductase family enzyme
MTKNPSFGDWITAVAAIIRTIIALELILYSSTIEHVALALLLLWSVRIEWTIEKGMSSA